MEVNKNGFEAFNPRSYLEEYYSSLGFENEELLRFFADAYRGSAPDSMKVLEIGGGPTVYQLISLAPFATRIHFTDYLQSNLDEVISWKNGDEQSFDWDRFIETALKSEAGSETVTSMDIGLRRDLLRRKLVSFQGCDVHAEQIIETDETYDLVSTNFVAESVSTNKGAVAAIIKKLHARIKPGGVLMMTGLLGAAYWHAGEHTFSAVPLTEDDVLNMLHSEGFVIKIMRTIPAQFNEDDPDFQGYSGIFMVKATTSL